VGDAERHEPKRQEAKMANAANATACVDVNTLALVGFKARSVLTSTPDVVVTIVKVPRDLAKVAARGLRVGVRHLNNPGLRDRGASSTVQLSARRRRD
jgi:hypothetical protein